MHKRLSAAVGTCIAAFAGAMLEGQTQPGVWYPEEKEAVSNRRAVLGAASKGCFRFEVGKPAWAMESKMEGIGLFYW